MVLANEIEAPVPLPDDVVGDQRVRIDGVSWETYDKLCELFDGRPAIRMTYLKGALEIMVVSKEHERRKKIIGRLVEAYADLCEIDLNGFGNATYRRRAKKRGLEPDDCYVLGVEDAEVPDIAIEVVVSHSVDKLEVYRGLGVREVWIYRGTGFTVHRLEGEGDATRYITDSRSRLVPGLDFDLLASFVPMKNQREAVARISCRAWTALKA